jgi:hypothetical protein
MNDEAINFYWKSDFCDGNEFLGVPLMVNVSVEYSFFCLADIDSREIGFRAFFFIYRSRLFSIHNPQLWSLSFSFALASEKTLKSYFIHDNAALFGKIIYRQTSARFFFLP